jgi:hypothetical protein
MLVFFPLAAFASQQFSFAMLISMVGGLALMAYQISLALQLIQISQPSPNAPGKS